jgi:uncharacterized protein
MRLVDALLDSVSGTGGTVQRVMVGLHWISVESRFTGIAHTFRGREGAELEDAGGILGKNVLEIAGRLRSWEPLDAGLGLAALCSLIEPRGENINVYDYILSMAPGRTITCIGRFPFCRELAETSARTHLLEMNPREGELPPFAAEEVIPESDMVVITGTTLINKSLERLLELSRGKICVVLGPSTPMSDVLFDFGATVIGGIRVVDPDSLFLSLMQGVKFYHKLEGIKPVARFRNYRPGSKSRKQIVRWVTAITRLTHPTD